MLTEQEALYLLNFMREQLAEGLASKGIDPTAPSIEDIVRVFVELYEDKAPNQHLLGTLLLILDVDYGLIKDNLEQVVSTVLGKIYEILNGQPQPDMQQYDIDLDNLNGEEFEELIAALFRNMGLNASVTQRSRDGGIDIIATTGQSIFSGKYLVQCKRWTKPVGEPTVRELYGVVSSERANKGILITTASFTDDAHRFASGKPLELIDREQLLALLDKHGLSSGAGGAKIDEPDEWQMYREELRRDPNNLLVLPQFSGHS